MRAVAVGKNREAEFAISVAQQKCRVARYTAAMCEVSIAIAHLRPPGQAEARSLVAPDVFNGAFELIVLASQHLIQSRFTDDPFVLEGSAIQIRN